MSYYTNHTAGLGGLIYIQHRYNFLIKKYVNKIPVELPKSELEALELSHNLSKAYEELTIHHNLLSILICTTIESIVNSAGIHIMSKKFYKQTVERSDIISKVRILVFSMHQIELSLDNIVLSKMKKLFDKRNSLVHPKANHMDFSKLEELASNVLDVEKITVSDLLKDFDDIMDLFYKYNLVHKIIKSGYDEEKCSELIE